MYDEGVSLTREIVDLGAQTGILEKSGVYGINIVVKKLIIESKMLRHGKNYLKIMKEIENKIINFL